MTGHRAHYYPSPSPYPNPGPSHCLVPSPSPYPNPGPSHCLLPSPSPSPSTSTSPGTNPPPCPGPGRMGPAEGAPPAGRPSRTSVELPCDAFAWQKYGEKSLVHPRRTRAYFRCAMASAGCLAKKYVDFGSPDPSTAAPVIRHSNTHNHPPPAPSEGPEPSLGVGADRRWVTSAPVEPRDRAEGRTGSKAEGRAGGKGEGRAGQGAGEGRGSKAGTRAEEGAVSRDSVAMVKQAKKSQWNAKRAAPPAPAPPTPPPPFPAPAPAPAKRPRVCNQPTAPGAPAQAMTGCAAGMRSILADAPQLFATTRGLLAAADTTPQDTIQANAKSTALAIARNAAPATAQNPEQATAQNTAPGAGRLPRGMMPAGTAQNQPGWPGPAAQGMLQGGSSASLSRLLDSVACRDAAGRALPGVPNAFLSREGLGFPGVPQASLAEMELCQEQGSLLYSEQGLVRRPQQGLVHPQQEGLVYPQQELVHPQQGLVRRAQQGLVRRQQQGLVQPQQQLLHTQQGLVHPQQELVHPQQGLVPCPQSGPVHPQQGLIHHSDDGSLSRIFDVLTWGGGLEAGVESGFPETLQASHFWSASPADSCFHPPPAGGPADTPSPAWSLQTARDDPSYLQEAVGLLSSLLQAQQGSGRGDLQDSVSSTLDLPPCLRGASSHEYGDLRDVVGPEVLHGSVEGVVSKAKLTHKEIGQGCNGGGYLQERHVAKGNTSAQGHMSLEGANDDSKLFGVVPSAGATLLEALGAYPGHDIGILPHLVVPTLPCGISLAMLSELAS